MKRFATVLALAGCLGGAAAAHAETPSPTILVEPSATVVISRTATSAEAEAAYHQAFSAAIAKGLAQAQFVTGAVGAKVGSIQQIVPRGGSVECFVPAEEGPYREWERYEGAQPDFVSVELFGGYAVAPVAAKAAPRPAGKKPSKKKHKHHARKSDVPARCEVSARVLLSYLLT